MSTTTRSRTLAMLGAALALLGTLAGCGGSAAETTADGTPILRVGVQKDGVRSVLTASGALEDLPYEIEWSEFTAGMPIVEAIAADEIDVAWVGSTPPIFGAASAADFKVVATVEEADKFQDSILVADGSPITSIDDLRGKSIAVMKGSSAHGLLLNTLNAAGLSIDDVEPQYLAPSEGLAAFQAGEVDAWAVWDPFVTQAVIEEDAIDLTELTKTQANDAYLQFEIAATPSLEDETKRENITHFVSTLNDAFQWAKKNERAWAEGWAKESGLPVEVTAAVVAKKQIDVVPVSPAHVESQQRLADAFTDAGEIPETIDFSSVVDSVLD